MSDKPSYLGLLNAVSVAETAAYEYLTAWAAVTPHEGVKATLLTVAAREGEHGLAFAKRINELGYNLRPAPVDPKQAERMATACSTEISDYDKMHALGVARIAEDSAKSGPDIFDKFFSDHSIDIQTGELLGRYIAEERQRATAAGVLSRRQGRPRRYGCLGWKVEEARQGCASARGQDRRVVCRGRATAALHGPRREERPLTRKGHRRPLSATAADPGSRALLR